MKNLEYKLFFRRNLPHIQPRGSTIFVTFRLAGTLPKRVVNELQEEIRGQEKMLRLIKDSIEVQAKIFEFRKILFSKWDAYLDKANTEPLWLKEPSIACIVEQCMHNLDNRVYELFAYCIMPNHVHSLFKPISTDGNDYHSLSAIMHSLKRHTAREGNKVLDRTGAFWAHESYDHFIRDNEDFERVISYILNNPVKAGLVEDWHGWKWSFVKENIVS